MEKTPVPGAKLAETPYVALDGMTENHANGGSFCKFSL